MYLKRNKSISRSFWTIFFFPFFLFNCSAQLAEKVIGAEHPIPVPASSRMEEYLHLLYGKKVACVVNHTSLIGEDRHLVDSLNILGIDITRLMVPEHGFRGVADAGAHISDGKDLETGIPIFSLYGENRKPSPQLLEGVDVVLFDLQDVGARFYTYISTLSYVMEACAEQGVPLVVLDRPNPNGHYVDGPILDTQYSSFVGLHSVPIVYGMTIGEYATMVAGEEWINAASQLDLTVIPCKDYDHNAYYSLPVAPSPNLPSDRAVLLYPSLCLFEGTPVSIGRGTNTQFQVIGHPEYKSYFTFTPKSGYGAKNPKLMGQTCYGISLVTWDPKDIFAIRKIQLSYLLDFYKELGLGEEFFSSFFYKLVGSRILTKQIVEGWTEEEIRDSWENGIQDFLKIRERYLMYPDFQGPCRDID